MFCGLTYVNEIGLLLGYPACVDLNCLVLFVYCLTVIVCPALADLNSQNCDQYCPVVKLLALFGVIWG